uniref:C2H2-type domain-containing protein n=1 Tax=Anopheles dirus TaxID=7168 RepID=A0A1Y9H2D1_9DIPT
MTKHYLTTNVMLQALTLNLDSYKEKPKLIDTFTLSLLEKLALKIQEFITDSRLVPFEGDASLMEMTMTCFHQDPNIVRCRFCNDTFDDYGSAIQHMHKHERHKKPIAEPDPTPIKPCYLKKNCIPKSNECLPKKMKKFLSKNITETILEKGYESAFLQTDTDNGKVMQLLEGALRKCYPQVKCYPFGSRIAGTGSFDSDLDVFVDLETVYGGRKHRSDVEDVVGSIERVYTALQKLADWEVKDMVIKARVPLLRVSHLHYDIKCDLTFSNGLAHRNSLLLQYMYSLQPTCRLLVCYLKEWNREGSLNSYTISLMVIFFYQCYGWLPSVASLQEDKSNDVIIDDWNTGFATPTLTELDLKSCGLPLPHMASLFFEFYTSQSNLFSLESEVVCPFLGRKAKRMRLSKVLFECPSSPSFDEKVPEMERLKHFMLEHQGDSNNKQTFAYNKPLVVQDPFELCHNVAKGIPADVASRLLRWFDLSGVSMRDRHAPT